MMSKVGTGAAQASPTPTPHKNGDHLSPCPIDMRCVEGVGLCYGHPNSGPSPCPRPLQNSSGLHPQPPLYAGGAGPVLCEK